ncbi:MAG: outer membrane beta-barrel protein [Cyclobacteriaceae bacterium]
MRQKIVLFFVFSLISYAMYAQSCTQKLNKAEDDYLAGRLLGIPKSLESCLADGSFSKEENIRAKKLLTLVYIFTDDEYKSEMALIELLKEDPEHTLNPQVDPSELFFLYNQFRVAPIFRIAFKGGVNFSQVSVIETHSFGDLNSNFAKYYNGNVPSVGEPVNSEGNKLPVLDGGSGLGLFGELTIERYFGNGIELAFGGQFRTSKYTAEQYTNTNELLTSMVHNQTYITAPLTFRYNFFYKEAVNNKKFIPYVQVGISADFLISSNYSSATRNGGTSYSLIDADTKSRGITNTFNYSLFGGLGLKYRVGNNFVTLEAKYSASRMNLINGDNRLSAFPEAFDLSYLEDDLALNFVSFSLGYTFSIYKPQKIED